MTEAAWQAAQAAARTSYGRLLALLAWRWRDIAAAEDALADAFAVGEYYVRNSGITDDGSVIPVVVGGGAIGLSAVAALARRGITPIIVADFNEGRLATARDLGATHTVDPRVRSPYDVWTELALGESSLAPHEIALVPSDEAVEPGHARRVGLGELGRPDPVGLLDAQAVDRAGTDRNEAEVGAHRRQRAPQ